MAFHQIDPEFPSDLPWSLGTSSDLFYTAMSWAASVRMVMARHRVPGLAKRAVFYPMLT
jgi:hypothetical protein